MPVAGGNVEVFHLLIQQGRLVNLGKHRYPAHLAVNDASKAVVVLLGGKTVYLKALGSNLATVMEQLQEVGVKV